MMFGQSGKMSSAKNVKYSAKLCMHSMDIQSIKEGKGSQRRSFVNLPSTFKKKSKEFTMKRTSLSLLFESNPTNEADTK